MNEFAVTFISSNLCNKLSKYNARRNVCSLHMYEFSVCMKGKTIPRIYRVILLQLIKMLITMFLIENSHFKANWLYFYVWLLLCPATLLLRCRKCFDMRNRWQYVNVLADEQKKKFLPLDEAQRLHLAVSHWGTTMLLNPCFWRLRLAALKLRLLEVVRCVAVNAVLSDVTPSPSRDIKNEISSIWIGVINQYFNNSIKLMVYLYSICSTFK